MSTPQPRPLAGVLLLACLVLLAGCAGLPTQVPDPAPGERPAVANLDAVPFHPQPEFHCGPATLLTLLEASGASPTFDQVVDRVYVPDLEGSLQAEMMAASRHFGRIPYRLEPTLDVLVEQLDAGLPVLVLLNLRLPALPAWHYAVVVGHDRDRHRLLLRSGDEPDLEMSVRRFMAQWDRAGRWALVVLEPGELPARPDRGRLFRTLADFEAVAGPAAARAAWQAAAGRWPQDPMAWLGVGNSAHALGDMDGAELAFRQAVSADPDHWPARINLATVLENRGRPCEAIGWLEPASSSESPTLADRIETLRQRLGPACEATDR